MRFEVVVRGVAPEVAWGWWIRFEEGAVDHAFAAWAHPDRRVEILEDGHVRLTETGRIWRWQFLEIADLQLARPRVKYDMRNNFGHFWGTYRFLPDREGTRIEIVWDQDLVRWLRWLGPLGRFALQQFYRWDMRHHVAALEREAVREPPRPGAEGREGAAENA